jgi:TP901 family phage tail tape measure protein
MVKAIGAAHRYEKAMAKIEAIASGGKLDKGLRNLAEQLSIQSGRDVEETSKAIYQAISAGVPKDNIFKFMETAARMAVVDNTELEHSVSALTSVYNTFGIENGKLDQTANQLFGTVKKGKIEMSELGAEFGEVASVAHSFGVPLDETLAAISAITVKTKSPSQSITQLRSALVAMIKEFGDGAFEGKSLAEAFEHVRAASNGSNKELMDSLRRNEALQAVLKTTAENSRHYRDTLKELRSEHDSIQDAMDGTTGDQLRLDQQMQKAKGAFREFGQVIKTILYPAFISLGKVVGKAADGFKMMQELAGSKKLGLGLKIMGLEAQGMLKNMLGGKGSDMAERTKVKALEEQIALINKNEKASAQRLARIAAEKKAEEEKAKAAEEAAYKEEQAKKAAEAAAQAKADAEKAAADAALEAQKKKDDEAAKLAEAAVEAEQLANKKHWEQVEKDERAALAKRMQNKVDALAKANEEIMFQGDNRGFMGRFQEFDARRKEAEDAMKVDEKAMKRLQRLKAKKERGVKLSREDREWIQRMKEFREAEKKVLDNEAEMKKIQKDIKELLEKNLEAADA